MEEEKLMLDAVAKTYRLSDCPQDRLIRDSAMRVFEPYLRGGIALELGCSDGYLTRKIAALSENLDVVDGSAYFLKRITDLKLVNVQVTECLFENFAPTKRYDYIFATFILEHVNDPVELLRKYSAFLSADGLLFIVVPNARALSRQLARHMGLLPELTSLTDNDVKHGHRRVYDRTSLNSDIKSAGLLQLAQGGILLKPFADFQMDRLIEIGVVGDAQADGLFKLGLEYPDLSGSLFSICRSS